MRGVRISRKIASSLLKSARFGEIFEAKTGLNLEKKKESTNEQARLWTGFLAEGAGFEPAWTSLP